MRPGYLRKEMGEMMGSWHRASALLLVPCWNEDVRLRRLELMAFMAEPFYHQWPGTRQGRQHAASKVRVVSDTDSRQGDLRDCKFEFGPGWVVVDPHDELAQARKEASRSSFQTWRASRSWSFSRTSQQGALQEQGATVGQRHSRATSRVVRLTTNGSFSFVSFFFFFFFFPFSFFSSSSSSSSFSFSHPIYIDKTIKLWKVSEQKVREVDREPDSGGLSIPKVFFLSFSLFFSLPHSIFLSLLSPFS